MAVTAVLYYSFSCSVLILADHGVAAMVERLMSRNYPVISETFTGETFLIRLVGDTLAAGER